VKSWVGPETALLREADAAGGPVLGVCFGGRLLAQAHGGTVGQSPVLEIGWYPVTSDHRAVVPEGAALDTRVLREHTRGAHDGAARRVRQLVAGFLGEVAGGKTLREPA
jgi:GMP synthase-like glutamine amidotransferase